MSNKNECAAALARVMQRAGVIPKDASLDTGRKGYQHDYRSKEGLFDALRPLLADEGVFMATKVRSVEPGPKGVVVLLDVTFHHGESGSIVECGGVGQGADANDKAVAKALTSAYRSFLDNVFMLGLNSDADLYREEEQKRQPEPASQPAKSFNREATFNWIFDALIDKGGMEEEEIAAYLDYCWCPHTLKVKEGDLDAASDEDVRALANFVRKDVKRAVATLKQRLEGIGYYGEPASGPGEGEEY